MRVCYRYAPNKEEAEQWVHDAFLKIFSTLQQYAFKGPLEAWMRRITVRICIDNLRKNNSKRFSIEQMTEPVDMQEHHYEIPVENDFQYKIQRDDIIKLLNQLPEKSRIVFNLHVFEGYEIREIAELLEIKENYVYWLLHQARKELQNFLKNPVTQKSARL